MMDLIQQNNWGSDDNSIEPIFSSGHQIAPRFDLSKNMLLRKNTGAIDGKVTNYKLFKNLKCYARSGPTHDANWNPPYEFKEGDQDFSFIPKVWDFGWYLMSKNVLIHNKNIDA